MLNEFSATAEQTGPRVAKYTLEVRCKCGWHGVQSQLLETNTKDRACPTCGAAFKRQLKGA